MFEEQLSNYVKDTTELNVVFIKGISWEITANP